MQISKSASSCNAGLRKIFDQRRVSFDLRPADGETGYKSALEKFRRRSTSSDDTSARRFARPRIPELSSKYFARSKTLPPRWNQRSNSFPLLRLPRYLPTTRRKVISPPPFLSTRLDSTEMQFRVHCSERERRSLEYAMGKLGGKNVSLR